MKKTDNILAAIDENDIDYLSNVEFDVDCRIAESDNDTFLDYELNTPLQIACYNGCLSLVKKLIEHQANPFIKTKKGNYPLACAVNEDKEDVVKYLVQTVY